MIFKFIRAAFYELAVLFIVCLQFKLNTRITSASTMEPPGFYFVDARLIKPTRSERDVNLVMCLHHCVGVEAIHSNSLSCFRDYARNIPLHQTRK